MRTTDLRTALTWLLLGLVSIASIATSTVEPEEDLVEGEDPVRLDVTNIDLGAVTLEPGGDPFVARARVTLDDPDLQADLRVHMDVFTLQSIEDIPGELQALWTLDWQDDPEATPFNNAPYDDEYDFGSWGSSGTKRGRGFFLDCQQTDTPTRCTIDVGVRLWMPLDVDVDFLEFEPSFHFELSFDERFTTTEPSLEIELL